MTASPMQIAANRCNALKSKGPRTVFGKLNSSQNARRHGLSIQTAVTGEVQQLARAILATVPVEAHTPILDKWAHLIAQASFDIERARGAKRDAYRQVALEDPHGIGGASELQDPAELHSASSEITRVIEEIRRVDRYEKRALSRWRKAVRYFRMHQREILAHMRGETRSTAQRAKRI